MYVQKGERVILPQEKDFFLFFRNGETLFHKCEDFLDSIVRQTFLA
jgi:hypothetical protein